MPILRFQFDITCYIVALKPGGFSPVNDRPSTISASDPNDYGKLFDKVY
jgi:hypothetical protein